MTSVLLLDQSGARAGGQMVAANLLEHLQLTSAARCVAVLPDGPVHERLARIPGLVTVRPATRRQWLRACLPAGLRHDWLVANSPRVLPFALAAKVLARVAGRRTRVAFVVHSNPSTTTKRRVVAALARGVDAVLPVAVTQWAPPGRVPLPPLGLRTADILPRQTVEENLRTPRRVVKAMGRRDRVKGLDVYLDAVQALDVPGWAFELATAPGLEGDEDYEARLAGRAGAVAVVGARNAQWIQPGDVVVIPSRDEAACLLAQEAMGRGAAVVASAVGDLPLYVRNGTTGVLVQPGDAAELADALRRVTAMADEDVASMCRRAHQASAERADRWYDAVAGLLTAGHSAS